MSIIYDALKKAENSNANTNDLKPAMAKGHNPAPGIKIYLLYILMVCLGILMAYILFTFISKRSPVPNSSDSMGNKKLQDNQKQTKPSSLDSSTQEYLTTTPSSPPPETINESPPSFILNGVFSSEDECYALVNNKIVRVGDKIDGAEVLRIDLDAVELELNGSVIKLSSGVK